VTIETRRRTLVRSRVRIATTCPICENGTPLLTTEEAAVLSGSSVREIYRRVEAGQIHFSESGDGLLLICRRSLAAL
jgi:hypothetical protein